MSSSSASLSIQMGSLFMFACFTLLAINVSAFTSSQPLFHFGAIFDEQSTVGIEQIVATRVAVREFNSQSDTLMLNITFKKPSVGLLSSANAAKELLKEYKVNTIIGMNEWIDAAAVGEIGSRANIPIISFSEPAVKTQFSKTHWPFLVTLASGHSDQIKCISAIIKEYKWKQVIAVYEENLVGGSPGELASLAENFKGFNAEIEYILAIPPFHSMSSPNDAIKEALQKVSGMNSRVFVVLQMSLPVTALLFKAANEMGLSEANSVWILGDNVANNLDKVDSSVKESSMQGFLGVKRYYSVNTSQYLNFLKKFRGEMIREYPDAETVPGINALRAYDAVATVAEAVKKSPENLNNSKQLLAAISSTDGRLFLRAGHLSNNELRIVNVVGNSYKLVDFYLPGNELSKQCAISKCNSQNLRSPIIWPGDFHGNPKGWAVPTTKNKMKIVVPGDAAFKEFVKVDNISNNVFKGFCIELFNKALEKLNYRQDFFKMEGRNGTCNELVDMVHNKTYDGLIGDITMLSERLDKVMFTSTYLDSGHSLISLAQPDESALMFLKPFNWQMWVATVGVLIYTTFAVWCMERKSSPELGRSWKDQMGNAVMFTLSSLFFVQRERLHNNLTRVVLIVWLFLVLVVSSSYTASLSAMLTAQNLRPSITDIDSLVKNNRKVACDNRSFLYQYIQTNYGFKPENIMNIESLDDVHEQLQSKKIWAAFMETPYKNSFFNRFCGKGIGVKEYNIKFGGLAFAFQKGSPFAEEISKAILELQLEGEIKKIEKNWFSQEDNCVDGKNFVSKSMELQRSWVLYAISAATTTVCLLFYIINSSNLGKRIGDSDSISE